MTRRISTILVLSLLAVVFVAMAAHAVKSPDESPRVINPRLQKAMHYALPYPDANYTPLSGADASVQPSEGISLGTASSSATPWPGVKIGDTWYDYQHNGRMPRMVDWGNEEGEAGWGFMIHFLWMRLETEVQVNRHYAYNVYYFGGGDCPTPGEFKGQFKMQQPGEYAGYVTMDVTKDGRGVLSGHNDPGGGYAPHTYWDYAAGNFSFGNNGRVPNDVMEAGAGLDGQGELKTAIWPSIRYQEHPSDENLNVLHVFAQVSEPGAGDPQAIIYFRKVGNNHLGVWDNPPYVVDTVHDIAQDVACSKTTGKAALVWVANLPSPATAPASSHGYWQYSQLDNDIWYQISDNYGASWGPMINVTQNVDGEAGYRPYTDLQALMTTDEHLHILWSGRVWPADANTGGSVGFDCRIFQWGTDLAAGNIRTVANLEYDQTHCSGGAWQMQGSKMSIGECDGKLYGMWTQFNDPGPLGMMNDCHQRALDGGTDQVGAANGELYLAVSDDSGLTWDAPRNLTNTHTPHCESASEPGGECRSEHWSNMNRLGTNLSGNWTGAVVIDPSGGYTGDYFLDVQYIADPDPGGIVQDEGTWQNADVRWFRLACVEPVPTAIFNPSWNEIGFPEYTEHGTMYTKPLTIENSGNTALNFTFTLNMDAGPYSTWLTVSANFQGTVNVPSGANNTITGDVYINADLTINTPGTIVHLSGNLTADGNSSTNPDVLPINFWVADTIIPPVFDTIYTRYPTCFALVIANTGNWGNQGAGHVNLDFFDYGDPDDLEGAEDTIPGDATVYAYDCSPVICWTDALDSVRCNWSIFGTSYLDDEAFFPWGHIPPVDMGDFELYQSEFVTRDTGILVKKLWIAPYFQDGGEAGLGCNFIIQVLKVMQHPLATGDEIFEGLNIGEAMDWDIPSDSAAWNRSGFDMTTRLIYQQGSEFNQDNDVEKQENSDRYGGLALLEIVEIDGTDTTTSTHFYGAYTEDNSRWVYPAGGFIESELDSMMDTNEGYVIETDSLDADLHAVMTFRQNYTLTPTKTLIIFKCLITSRLGYASFIDNVVACHDWYQEHLVPKITGACCIEEDCFVMSEQACLDAGGVYKGDGVSCDPNPCLGCCMPPIRGNVDYDGGDAIDISDLVYLVDYMFTGGPEPPCFEEADMNGDTAIDISDLVWLVDYMFTGGPPPVACP